MGDQFLALAVGRRQAPDEERHLGLVVDHKEVTRRALEAAGAEILPSRGVDFRDPWGNHLQVVKGRCGRTACMVRPSLLSRPCR